jgi:capsular polysaccharide biosynthesis protein
MELKEYLQTIKKKVWLILLITIAAAVTSTLVSKYVIKPTYQAKSALIVSRAPNDLDERLRYDDILMYERLIKTYGELAKSTPVLEETISKLGFSMDPEALRQKLTVTSMADTQIMEIAVEDTNPKLASELANTLSQVFIERAKVMLNTADVKIMENAKIPAAPIRPIIILNTAIAFILGLMLSLGLISLIEYLDNTLKTENDIEKYLAVAVLASIPYEKNRKHRK